MGGQTNVDTRQSQDDITSLAQCLQIRLENLETQSKGEEGKIKLRNMSEIMKPGFGLNNNPKVMKISEVTAKDDKKEFFCDSEEYFECEKMEDCTDVVGKQDDIGWMSKPMFKCLYYCGKGFEDV